MNKVVTLLTFAVMVCVGCHHRPLQVCGVISPGDVVRMAPTTDHRATPVEPRVVGENPPHCACRVALIDLDGLLVNRNLTGLGSLGENPVAIFREKLDRAAREPGVRAVVLRINSPGGGVTACDIMRRDLVEFKARTGVPVVACLMDLGTGGAYFVATAADMIVAHPTTVTGGLGVIMNVYNMQDTLAQFNVFATPVKAGELADVGSPIKALTPESREVLQGVADEFHERLREVVLSTRPQMADKPTTFDGRIFTAREAKSLHLVDQTGYLDDAISIAQEMAGIGPGAELVLFRRDNDRAQSPYDITPNIPLQNSLMPVSVPGLDRSQLPTFLYLWQPDPLLEKTGGN